MFDTLTTVAALLIVFLLTLMVYLFLHDKFEPEKPTDHWDDWWD